MRMLPFDDFKIQLPTALSKGQNIYNLVVLDESHEHNTNMDLIVTLMNEVC